MLTQQAKHLTATSMERGESARSLPQRRWSRPTGHRAPSSAFPAAIGMLSWLLMLCTLASAQPAGADKEEDFFDLSIEELMNTEITSVATLTESSARMAPAALTTITQEQIQASGARSLLELLDIYVPNLQWIRQHWEPDHLGLRGIMSQRDDKYLLLVNGRVMNERTHFGAVSERDLVLLRDIHHIDIVRGPGSALYGPGAVSMVIDIVTDSAKTFQGTEVTTRLGVVEEFYSMEVKHGQTEPEQDAGVFVYAGIGKYLGADKHDAPQIFAFDFPDESDYDWWDPAWGTYTGPEQLPADDTEAGEPMLSPSINRDGEPHRNLPPVKVHAQITKGNWDLWARYTRGGQQFVWDVGILARADRWGWADYLAQPPADNSYGYQQATGYIGYKKDLSERVSLDAALSYDLFDYERVLTGDITEAHREDECYARLLLNWRASPAHRFAVGSELSHEEFGIHSPGYPDGAAVSAVLGDPMPRWDTDMVSFLGEHQWTINDRWTTFLGARVDNHTYSRNMFSPRAAVVHTANAKDTWKLIWARSTRVNSAEELKAEDLDGNDNSRPETLGSLELRYERQHNAKLNIAATAFLHYDLELIEWYTPDDPNEAGRNLPVGTQREWGLELEAAYHTDRTRLALSHGFTKLYDFDLDENRNTIVTAEPYGYGDDLANWSNHITKITGRHRFDDHWTLDGSLRVYWGFPGMEDYGRYNPYTKDITASPRMLPVIEPGWEKGYRSNWYLNLGLQYRPSENLTIRLDGYNLLGMFDKDLNKRNYYSSYGDYRSHAAAVGLSLTYAF